MSRPKLSAPTFEHHPDGLGIGHSRPRVSWRFEACDESNIPKDWVQSSYSIEVSKAANEKGQIFNVDSSESVLVPWPGEELSSRQRFFVRVKAYATSQHDSTKCQTEWSPWSIVEVALLNRSEWIGQPITSEEKYQNNGETLRPLRFRKRFSWTGGHRNVATARLYVTAFGVYEAFLNGKRIGNHALAPGWQSYSHRHHYQVFDVAEQVLEDNILAVEVAEGWYAGHLGFQTKRFIYGDEIAVLAQLEIEPLSEVEEKLVIVTDTTWKCNKSAIVSSGLYHGELYDMREETGDWKTTQLDDKTWGSVKAKPFPTASLVAPDAPPVRVTQVFEPIDVFKSPSGRTIIDFGQNLVGVLRVQNLTGLRNHRITFSHAEVLEHGELALRPLRDAKCVDTVVLSDHLLGDWSPKFTFHGFRYVQVDGWPGGTPNKADFTAQVLHTDMKRRGWFSCSNEMVNKFHDNVVWGMRGNFLSIPTDCPQRDERLGWTGDIQVFASSATFLYDTVGMLSNWLEDVAAEQLAQEDGIPGLVVPDVLPDTWIPTAQAVWHDVVILTPWDIFTFSSDYFLLKRQYRSMRAYLDRAIRRGPDRLWHPDVWQLGDWLDPAAPADDPGNARTDGILVADAYLIHTTSKFSKICDAIGKSHEAMQAASHAKYLKEAFQHKYITRAGLLVNQTQTALALAIVFDLFPSELFHVGADSLARKVRSSKFRIATGFAGTPVICHALSKSGQTDLAYRMMLEKHCPSWLYPITMGATTIWERWDSLLPNGELNPGSMLSFNHYALGSVVSWLHATVGGISSTDGWKTIIVAPEPGGNIDTAETKFDGPYGLVTSTWKVWDGTFTLKLTIPPNSRAKVRLPGRSKAASELTEVGSGRHEFVTKYETSPWPPKEGPQPFWGSWGAEECTCGS